jgi:predicted PurR-regulated permease PerM
MNRKGMNVSLSILLAFVLAALVISVSVYLLTGGVENLREFIQQSIDIEFGFI